MTSEQLEAIRQRVANSTPGPWEWETNAWDEYQGIVGVLTFNYGDCWGHAIEIEKPDAELITHAREDLELLLQEVGRLQEWQDRVMTTPLTAADEGKHIEIPKTESHTYNFPFPAQ